MITSKKFHISQMVVVLALAGCSTVSQPVYKVPEDNNCTETGVTNGKCKKFDGIPYVLPQTALKITIPVVTTIETEGGILNEEANIGRCLASVDWSDDVVVLDSLSSDGTADAGKRLGARVFSRAFDDFAGQRNYALDHVDFRHEWILHLDADVIVTDALREELAAAIGDPRFAAYRLAGKLMFHKDKWLRFSGMYPVYQVRLGRKGALRFAQAGHGQREAIDPALVGTLRQPYLHYGFSKGLADWLERHNRYSTAGTSSRSPAVISMRDSSACKATRSSSRSDTTPSASTRRTSR